MKIKKFNELYEGPPVDVEVSKKLKLDKYSKDIKDDRYFFTEKTIKKNGWDNHIFCIVVKKIKYDNKTRSVIIDTEVTYKNNDYDISIVIDSNDNTYFGSRKSGELERLNKDASGQIGIYYNLTENLINEILPIDFWEVRKNAS